MSIVYHCDVRNSLYLCHAAEILGLSPNLFSSLMAIAGLTLFMVVVLIAIALCIFLRETYLTKKALNNPPPLRSSQSLNRKASDITQNVYVEHDNGQHGNGTDAASSHV